jgi:DNA gyrase subunit A
MKTAYIDYSMSVIVSRHFQMLEMAETSTSKALLEIHDLGVNSRSSKKSAGIGEVLGKYHPHGDTSVYDAMVRMAQEWMCVIIDRRSR